VSIPAHFLQSPDPKNEKDFDGLAGRVDNLLKNNSLLSGTGTC
jgi:hypothetical protein